MAVKTVTLTANTVMKLVQGSGTWSHTAVYNRSTTDTVYATLKGADPVADADDVYCVPPGARREMHYANQTGNDLRVISPGAAKIEVEWAK